MYLKSIEHCLDYIFANTLFRRGRIITIDFFSLPHLNYWCANRSKMLIASPKCNLKLVTKHNVNPVSSCTLSKWLNLSVVFLLACLKGGLNLPEAAQVLWTVPSWCCLYEQQHIQAWGGLLLPGDGASRDIEYFGESCWVSFGFYVFFS